MPDLQQTVQYLRDHADELAAVSGDPDTFRDESAALLQSLAAETDEEERLRLLRKVLARERYPAVVDVLAKQGLEPWATETSATRAPAPGPASPAAAAAPPVSTTGGGTMEDQSPSQETVDRLAVWDRALAIGKESVTGCLGIMIVMTTLLVAAVSLVFIGMDEAYSAAKDILLILTSLAGVVLGYYFGRVPAEVRADKAEGQAKASASSLAQVRALVRGEFEQSAKESARAGEGKGPGLHLSEEQVARLRRIVG